MTWEDTKILYILFFKKLVQLSGVGKYFWIYYCYILFETTINQIILKMYLSFSHSLSYILFGPKNKIVDLYQKCVNVYSIIL